MQILKTTEQKRQVGVEGLTKWMEVTECYCRYSDQ